MTETLAFVREGSGVSFVAPEPVRLWLLAYLDGALDAPQAARLTPWNGPGPSLVKLGQAREADPLQRFEAEEFEASMHARLGARRDEVKRVVTDTLTDHVGPLTEAAVDAWLEWLNGCYLACVTDGLAPEVGAPGSVRTHEETMDIMQRHGAVEVQIFAALQYELLEASDPGLIDAIEGATPLGE